MNTDKQENIKDHIITIATQIFSKFGFRKTTINDIADEMGKGKSSIYYYFKSKEEIYKEVIQREAELFKNEVYENVINTSQNPKDKLRNYVLKRMKFLKELVNFNEALRNDYLKSLPFIEKLREKYDNEEFEAIKGILDEGIDKGIFNITETEFAATAFVTAMKGLEVPLFIKNDYTLNDLEVRLDDMLHILFYGLVNQKN
ncbi:MAG: TetR/AcrR family transcriptional regulator [Bacteroidota bacterium]